ncbi:hypothetical protein C7B76_01790 [filamentous cyanobacterium CCP2]|nr:hypothetical protein C7B76_01790 [filamentous cyanobacterium CCP2]
MPLDQPQHEKFCYQPFSCPLPINPIHLDFSDLKAFELVREQYHQWGIRFEGAIALRPSNPSFGAAPEAIVLTPEAGRSIAVHFEQLQRMVGAFVTATQQIKLTLFNHNNEPIAEQYAGTTQYVKGQGKLNESFPQYHLELLKENIAKVEFSSDAPFILHSFFCG